MCNNVSHVEMSKIGRFQAKYRLQETESKNYFRSCQKRSQRFETKFEMNVSTNVSFSISLWINGLTNRIKHSLHMTRV